MATNNTTSTIKLAKGECVKCGTVAPEYCNCGHEHYYCRKCEAQWWNCDQHQRFIWTSQSDLGLYHTLRDKSYANNCDARHPCVCVKSK